VVESVGEPKVGNDDIAVLVKEQVFQFEITVDYVFLVKVVDAGDQLGEELLGVSFLEVSIGENVVKELSTCNTRVS
jgi:hypothetical protein